MAATPVVNFRLPTALLERIDAARGEESRTSWLIRAAEAQLAPSSRADARRLEALGAPVASAEAKAGVFPR